MTQLTFTAIYTSGEKVFENDLYLHNHDAQMLLRYDTNYIEFKRMPSLPEFQEAEAYLRLFHQKHGQNHLKFYFPDKGQPDEELFNYMKQKNYATGYMELYAINPGDFPDWKAEGSINVDFASDMTFTDFLELQYEQEKEYGEGFAAAKLEEHRRFFTEQHVGQVIAYYEGKPAGSLNVFHGKDTVEIDSLYVRPSFRKKGIAAQLQKFVMNQFPDQTVILVADGEDTPREMYKKQNYTCLSYKYEALKVME